MLAPQDIGVEASRTSPAISTTTQAGSAVRRPARTTLGASGAGDGTFASVTGIDVGARRHGIVVLDVDGDGDGHRQRQRGVHRPGPARERWHRLVREPTYFDGGVNGEYGLAAADMNGDGITDLVVSGCDGQQINTMLGNGNGRSRSRTGAGVRRAHLGRRPWRLERRRQARRRGRERRLRQHRRASRQRRRHLRPADAREHRPARPVGRSGRPRRRWGPRHARLELRGRLLAAVRQRRHRRVQLRARVHRGRLAVLLDPARHRQRRRPRHGAHRQLADTVTIMENASAASSCSPAPSACRAPLDAGKSGSP